MRSQPSTPRREPNKETRPTFAPHAGSITQLIADPPAHGLQRKADTSHLMKLPGMRGRVSEFERNLSCQNVFLDGLISPSRNSLDEVADA